MTMTHNQAMNYIYEQVLERLMRHMSAAQRASMQLLVQRLLVAAGGTDYIGTFRLLVVHGNDRRSARLLAMLRAAQLCIALRAPATFQLRVLVACLPGPGSAVVQRHERCFNALFMADDPRVNLQIIEGAEAVPFEGRSTFHRDHWSMHRRSLLLFGHLQNVGGEALLGCRLHLELADAVCRAIDDNAASADAIVTALPERQRRRYLAWARRTLRQADPRAAQAVQQCLATLMSGLSQLNAVAGSPLETPSTSVAVVVEDRMPLLGVKLDDLLLHLHDESQLDEMLQCAGETALDSPSLGAFLDPTSLERLADLQARCAQTIDLQQPPASAGRNGDEQAALGPDPNAYGLEPAQCSCLLFRPFADHGRNLETFLRCRHPDMLVALPYLLRALQGKDCPDAVKDWLVNTSGLALTELRAIFEGKLPEAPMQLLARLARRDVCLRLLPRGGASR